MKNALKAELRKLFTVRSTYIMIIANLLLVMFFAGFVEGFRAAPASLLRPDLLASEAESAVILNGLLLSISGLLLLGHEYRYNTIMYTLTSTNKRLKPFFAKIIATSLLALGFGLFITFFSPLCTIIGAHIHGLTISHQTFDVGSLLWRCMFVMWGYMMYAFVLVAIIRSQIGAIVTLLITPLVGENILVALLRDNAKYLPFTSLQIVSHPTALSGASAGQGALTAFLYVIVGVIVATYLFLRRDAN